MLIVWVNMHCLHHSLLQCHFLWFRLCTLCGITDKKCNFICIKLFQIFQVNDFKLNSTDKNVYAKMWWWNGKMGNYFFIILLRLWDKNDVCLVGNYHFLNGEIFIELVKHNVYGCNSGLMWWWFVIFIY